MTSTMSKLEQSELACQNRDAAEFKGFFRNLWAALTKPHDPKADPLEAAILAVQQKDLEGLKIAAARVRQQTATPAKIKAFKGPAHA